MDYGLDAPHSIDFTIRRQMIITWRDFTTYIQYCICAGLDNDFMGHRLKYHNHQLQMLTE